METKRFAELLKNPMLVDDLPVEELRELTARYPFSASLQMLLLKKYQLDEHPAYDEQLAKAAVYAPDRRALYRLVQLRERVVVNPEGFEPRQHTELESLEPIEQDTEEIATKVATEPVTEYGSDTQSVPLENTLTETELAIVEEDLEEEQHIEETVVAQTDEAIAETEAAIEPVSEGEQEAVKQEEQTEAEPVFTGLVPPVIVATHWETIEGVHPETIDAPDAETAQEHEPDTEPQEIAPGAIVEEETIIEATIETVVDVPEAVAEGAEAEEKFTTEVVLEAKEPLETQGKNSFMGWLRRLKHEQPQPAHSTGTSNEPEIPEVDEKAALDALFGAGTYEATLTKEVVEMPEPVQEQAPEKPSKEDLMQPDDDANRRMDEQAKKSLNLGEELVTETLARIYEIQKKTAKAIEAYEILKQRHPHKAAEYNRKIQSLREI